MTSSTAGERRFCITIFRVFFSEFTTKGPKGSNKLLPSCVSLVLFVAQPPDSA